ncbi:Xylulose kinase [Sporomusa carbonis]|uniref:gluconokinase n=1 Tax=Sporomusa carbonis TaxID=3076075 RepID=UPI003A7A7945
MIQPIMVGVDIGTTGIRSVAYRLDGSSTAVATEEYPLSTDQSGIAEQDADTIMMAMEAVISRTVRLLGDEAAQIKGIAFSSVLHSFLAIGEDGRPLSRLMTWADTRGQIYLEELKQKLDAKALYRRTGCPLHPMYSLLKIYWLKKQQPELFKRVTWFGSIKDYAFHRLTGKRVVDRSIASGSGVYNLFTLEWDPEVLDILGISQEKMPAVVSTTTQHSLQSGIAQRLGLPAGLPVIIGAGDGMMANVGVGAVKAGQINITIGTSGAIRMAADQPKTDEKGRTWCYNLADGRWMLGGAINNGGISFRWVRDKFAETEQRVAEKLGLDSYSLLATYAQKVPAGANGLILLPFFTGERAPYWNADARGVLFGLTLNHDKRHIIRAVLEGICYRMKSVLLSLEEITGKAEEIRVSGSFTRSEVWLQILADVLGREISLPNVEEGAAFGAAILGFYTLGLLPSIDVAVDMVGIKKTFIPNPNNYATYEKLYTMYEQVYWNLQEQFSMISNFQRSEMGKEHD